MIRLPLFRRKQIVTTLRGGLGNQMFQYAVGRRLAYKTGARLGLWLGTEYEPGSFRQYGLQQFPIAGQVLHSLPALPIVIEPTIREQTTSATPAASCDILFQTSLLQHQDSVHLKGYWQNERYFTDIATSIRREFTCAAELDPRSRETLTRIIASNAAFLHVRRTDYTLPEYNGFFGVCAPAYYHRAVSALRARHGDAIKLFVFSDDPGWVKDNDIGGKGSEIVDWNAGHAARDLTLMRACRHAVIANSTFSWWGAWLGEQPGNTIIAPQIWYAGAPHYQDIVPERWLRL